MATIPVIGLGAGGHAKVVVEILQFNPKYALIGLLEANPELKHTSLLGLPILGNDDEMSTLKARGVEHFFVGLGSASNMSPRRLLYELALQHGLKPCEAVHPAAVISPTAVIGQGATIMAGAIINAATTLGSNVIINSGAILEHDCVIADHVHIAPGAVLSGAVHIGEETHIGVGAVIKQGIRIGSRVVVGAGAVVLEDVPDSQTVAGNPARSLSKRNE